MFSATHLTMVETNLFLAVGLRDPVELGNVWLLKTAERVALDDLIWISVIRQLLE